MTSSEKAFQAGGKACVEAQRNVSMEYSRNGEKLGLFQVWWVRVKEWQAYDASGRAGRDQKIKDFFFDPELLELCFFILLVFSPSLKSAFGFLNLSIISLFSVSLIFAFIFIILFSCFLEFLVEL